MTSSSKIAHIIKEPSETHKASYLYNLSLLINATSPEANSVYARYHPSVFEFLGFPHDTFAVQFAIKYSWLLLYMQVLFITIVFVFFVMIVFIVYMHLFEGKTIQQRIEEDKAEYANLMNMIEKKHREARGEIGLTD